MQEDVAQGIGFGVLHGVSTFLPVSRDGHVALAEMLFAPKGVSAAEEMVLVCGTLFATLVVTRGQLAGIARALARRVRRRNRSSLVPEERDLLAIVLSQLATMVFWSSLGDGRRELARQPLVVGVGFLLTAMALFSTMWIGPRKRLHPSWVDALLIGAVQGMALIPGISRSGCTIVAAMWMGLTERRSFELSMLVSIPLTLVTMVDLRAAAAGSTVSLTYALVCLGCAAAAGIGAARLLRAAVLAEKTLWFGMWVTPLAITTLAFARAWPVR